MDGKKRRIEARSQNYERLGCKRLRRGMHTLPEGYAIFIDQNGWYFWANHEGKESKGSKDKWAEHHAAIEHDKKTK